MKRSSGILTIIRKELARFFGDKRVALTTVLLPGILIYVLYSFMGSALTGMYTVEEDYVPKIYSVMTPDSVAVAAEAAELPLISASPDEAAALKTMLTEKDADLLLVFPEDFDAAVAAYSTASGMPAPNIEIYFNSSSTESEEAYMRMTGFLSAYESLLANKFDINAGGGAYDLATEKDTAGSIFASMMPMLLMIFLFSGCMAVAPESIAGEKERGTIATMLVTPIRRSDIAVGKIIALAAIALLAGCSSTLGTILSLPKLMGDAADHISGDIYGIGDYLILGAIILSTILLLITLISLVSAFAKSVKEAQTYVMPLMILVMLIGVSGMFGGGAKDGIYYYLIPLYSSVQCMTAVFQFETVNVNLLASIVSNIVYTGFGVFLLTRMFNSEKIIFLK